MFNSPQKRIIIAHAGLAYDLLDELLQYPLAEKDLSWFFRYFQQQSISSISAPQPHQDFALWQMFLMGKHTKDCYPVTMDNRYFIKNEEYIDTSKALALSYKLKKWCILTTEAYEHYMPPSSIQINMVKDDTQAMIETLTYYGNHHHQLFLMLDDTFWRFTPYDQDDAWQYLKKLNDIISALDKQHYLVDFISPYGLHSTIVLETYYFCCVQPLLNRVFGENILPTYIFPNYIMTNSPPIIGNFGYSIVPSYLGDEKELISDILLALPGLRIIDEDALKYYNLKNFYSVSPNAIYFMAQQPYLCCYDNTIYQWLGNHRYFSSQSADHVFGFWCGHHAPSSQHSISIHNILSMLIASH